MWYNNAKFKTVASFWPIRLIFAIKTNAKLKELSGLSGKKNVVLFFFIMSSFLFALLICFYIISLH